MASTKYKLKDAAKMLRSLESGNNSSGLVDANADGTKSKTDVETMLKQVAGWDTASAVDPYKGREVTPSEYGDAQAYLLGKTVNREPFQFSGGGALYDAYAKAYKREGDLAMKDTLSKASAMSGGVPSSYAVSAASQAKNQYGAALADKVPELYQMELEKYYADAEQDRADLSTLMGVKSQELSEAQAKAELGDYSWLSGLGVDTSALEADRAYAERQRLLENALTAAEVGDYSGLAELGIDTEYLLGARDRGEEAERLELALQLYNATGDTSYLSDLGADVSRLLEEQQVADEASRLENAYTAAQLARLQAETAAESGYSDAQKTAINTKLMMGPSYWDDDVKEYARSQYDMEPIDLYYLLLQEDEETMGVSYYEVLKDSLADKGVSVRVISPEEWEIGTDQLRSNLLKQYGVSSYQDYLRAIAAKYL